MEKLLEKTWYEGGLLVYLLIPFSWIYIVVISIRRFLYGSGLLAVQRVDIPVIVVGNISVGGTGKTPLVIWLAEFLKERGMKPGIISRGYGGRTKRWPQQVRADSNPGQVGDEPVLLAQRTACPVAVSPCRYQAASELHEHTACDILLCDDGLQHLGLHRDLEIAVIDGDRRFGNGHCLPAGPLREKTSRLEQVDMLVANAKAGKNEFLMEYVPGNVVSLLDESRILDIEALKGQDVHAVAGIGNPQRFFSYLRSLGLRVIIHQFPDHYDFSAEDLGFSADVPVVMTEKDAVKCRSFANENYYYLKISVKMSNAFEHRFNTILKEVLENG